jgi:hypothetical protein
MFSSLFFSRRAFDRVDVKAYAAEELIARPGESEYSDAPFHFSYEIFYSPVTMRDSRTVTINHS